MKVSVLVLTFNEAGNLPRFLDALSFCDDIVAVDSGSTDGTVEILESRGVQVIKRPFDNFADQRNFGLDSAEFKNEWILHLDADEVLTPEFVRELEVLEPPMSVHAYLVPAKTIFFGRWLRWAGMWPSYQARLGRRSGLRFRQVGHGQREDLPGDQLSLFPEAYLHYTFSHGLRVWLEKHMRYAVDEVESIVSHRCLEKILVSTPTGVGRRRLLKHFALKLPLLLRPFIRFFYVYVVRFGFLDGRRGLAYAFMLAVYEGMIAVLGFERLGWFGKAQGDAILDSDCKRKWLFPIRRAGK